ncbi:MAG: metalloregulator ArsR/SmtB family transcription factor [Kiritimatiellales bacterium]|nr:metalloregulator ArsR/SmtB family transcription factor [Kiritimatiellales bacterium]
MNKLRPTLWRTCRALANTTRLTLLRKLLFGETKPVCKLAAQTGISEQLASRHLRTLASRGLLHASQISRWVYYSAEANENVDNAVHILASLKNCFLDGITNEEIMEIVTSFTHPRRILIVARLNQTTKTFDELMVETDMSSMALFRHIKKLEKRGFIRHRKDHFELTPPRSALGMVLMQIAAKAESED